MGFLTGKKAIGSFTKMPPLPQNKIEPGLDLRYKQTLCPGYVCPDTNLNKAFKTLSGLERVDGF